MIKLDRDFYNRDTLEVARELLGKYIVHRDDEGNLLVAMIVETEAYIGAIDKAAHSYNYKKTPRTEVMFGPAGHSYVYFIYGMYYCFNIVTQKEGEPAAVLIRGAQPIKEMNIMSLNRYNLPYDKLNKTQMKNLTNGPGKLCKAMDITKAQNGEDLLGDKLYVAYPKSPFDFEIVTSKRINIDYAQEAKDFLWRFYIKDNPYVSRK